MENSYKEMLEEIRLQYDSSLTAVQDDLNNYYKKVNFSGGWDEFVIVDVHKDLKEVNELNQMIETINKEIERYATKISN